MEDFDLLLELTVTGMVVFAILSWYLGRNIVTKDVPKEEEKHAKAASAKQQ